MPYDKTASLTIIIPSLVIPARDLSTFRCRTIDTMALQLVL